MKSIEIKSIGTLIDQLITVDIKCFMEQEHIMTAGAGDNVSEHAIKAQKLNAERNQLIRAIDNRLGEKNITMTEKTYE